MTQDMTPIVRELGVRELTRTNLDGLVEVRGPRWSVDPVTLKGEIGEARLVGIRDGERDFGDAISTLLSENDIGTSSLGSTWGTPIWRAVIGCTSTTS